MIRAWTAATMLQVPGVPTGILSPESAKQSSIVSQMSSEPSRAAAFLGAWQRKGRFSLMCSILSTTMLLDGWAKAFTGMDAPRTAPRLRNSESQLPRPVNAYFHLLGSAVGTWVGD